FGKGGRDAIVKELASRDIKVVADVSTEAGQADFAADVIKVKGANADAAFGVKGHVGLTVDAPVPAIQEFGRKYEAKFKSKPDHNGVKGYIAPYMIKAAAEKAGKLDGKAI